MKTGVGKKLNYKNIKVEDQTKWVQRQEKSSNTVPSVQPKVQQLLAPPAPPGMEAKVQEFRRNSGNTTVQTTPDDWSPLDDDVKVYLPSSVSPVSSENDNNMPSKEEVDLHIQEVLFGRSQKKRLEVFTKIFPGFNVQSHLAEK